MAGWLPYSLAFNVTYNPRVLDNLLKWKPLAGVLHQQLQAKTMNYPCAYIQLARINSTPRRNVQCSRCRHTPATCSRFHCCDYLIVTVCGAISCYFLGLLVQDDRLPTCNNDKPSHWSACALFVQKLQAVSCAMSCIHTGLYVSVKTSTSLPRLPCESSLWPLS